MRSRHDRYALAAAAVLLGGAAFETYRLLSTEHPWPGYTAFSSRSVSAFLIVLWLTTAVAVNLRRRHRVLAGLAWFLSFAAPLFMVAHAAITRVGGSALGLAYLPLAALLIFALKRTFDEREWQKLPTRDPGGRPPGAERAYRTMPRP